MPYSSQKYEVLYDILQGDMTGILGLGHERVSRYRAKTYFSGDYMDAAVFPLWSHLADVQWAATLARYETTRETQKNLNGKNARKRLQRLIDCNIGPNDLFLSLDYIVEPEDMEQVHRDFVNFVRRVNRYRKSHGLPRQRYICIPEIAPEESKRKYRIHLHVFMTGGGIGYRDAVEGMWPHGLQTNSTRLQPDEAGLEAIVTYVMKDPDGVRPVRLADGKKRWWGSRNLKKPKESVADKKIRKRDVEALLDRDADGEIAAAAPEIFERRYPGWTFLDCEVRRSPWVPGAYIYVRMRRGTG